MGTRIIGEGQDILSPAQVGALVGRHAETVTLALRTGQLRGKQRTVGGYWYVRREDAIAWALGEEAA